jgi:2'-5' RNA ligase
MKTAAIVYWLLPAKPERDLFCDVVRILRQEFRAPNFEPHLTLFVSTKTAASTNRVLQKIRTKPIPLKIRGVALSEKFTKTLFVRFKSSPELRKLANELSRAAKSRAKVPRDPHVSLLYKKIPRETKEQLAKIIKLPFRSVRFNSIAAVRMTLPVHTGADVEKWKIIAKKSLRQ